MAEVVEQPESSRGMGVDTARRAGGQILIFQPRERLVDEAEDGLEPIDVSAFPL